MQTPQQLLTRFRELGVDVATPGFYDSPEFMRAERNNPALLVSYAEYVSQLEFDEEYLARCREIITRSANFLYNELAADGRRGACIDISSTLLRFLEKQNVWCFFIGGGLRITFPPASGLPRRWFWPLMGSRNRAVMGHAWIYAPPFKVVDLSFSLQPHPAAQQRLINGYVLSEQSTTSEEPLAVDDFMENELVDEFVGRNRRMPTMNDVRTLAPQLAQFIRDFPAFEIVKDDLRLKYVPCGTSAPDGPMERMTSLQLRGRYAQQLFDEFRRGQ